MGAWGLVETWGHLDVAVGGLACTPDPGAVFTGKLGASSVLCSPICPPAFKGVLGTPITNHASSKQQLGIAALCHNVGSNTKGCWI